MDTETDARQLVKAVVLKGPTPYAQAYTPALLMPASCFLAGWGAVYGPHWVDQVLAFITSFDVRVTTAFSMCMSAALSSHYDGAQHGESRV